MWGEELLLSPLVTRSQVPLLPSFNASRLGITALAAKPHPSPICRTFLKHFQIYFPGCICSYNICFNTVKQKLWQNILQCRYHWQPALIPDTFREKNTLKNFPEQFDRSDKRSGEGNQSSSRWKIDPGNTAYNTVLYLPHHSYNITVTSHLLHKVDRKSVV